jgi:replication factor A1
MGFLKVKVIQLRDSTSDKVTQTSLIGDETGVRKFTIWRTSGALHLEDGKSYASKISSSKEIALEA